MGPSYFPGAQHHARQGAANKEVAPLPLLPLGEPVVGRFARFVVMIDRFGNEMHFQRLGMCLRRFFLSEEECYYINHW